MRSSSAQQRQHALGNPRALIGEMCPPAPLLNGNFQMPSDSDKLLHLGLALRLLRAPTAFLG
jgi:hypothetical protein